MRKIILATVAAIALSSPYAHAGDGLMEPTSCREFLNMDYNNDPRFAMISQDLKYYWQRASDIPWSSEVASNIVIACQALPGRSVNSAFIFTKVAMDKGYR